MITEYKVIIDTDSYTGNFERELCAYCTGQIGECEVGSEYIDKDEDYSIFEESIYPKPDEHGCSRPVSICSNDDGDCKSLEIYFENEPTKEELEFIKRKCRTFNKFYTTKGSYNKPVNILRIKSCRVQTEITETVLKQDEL